MSAPALPEDPRLGQVLEGRYRVLSLLAEGGMGAVYVAETLADGRRVAIKCLHAHYARDAGVVARFHREARAAASIGHPHIVEVIEMGALPDGAAFMVLELLEGEDLGALLRREGPLPLGRLVRIVRDVCDALAAAHDKGIVHRDLKPENVFLTTRDGQRDFVKLLDFGVSKFKDATPETDGVATRTGTALGTPYYMAPEQAQGKRDVDARVDLYALGVILFRGLTGQHPFDDASFPMLVVKICTEPPPPLRTYRTDLPPAFDAVVARLLAKDREKRPTSAAEVRDALAPFADVDVQPVLTHAPPTSSLSSSALETRADPHARTAPSTPSARPRVQNDDEDDDPVPRPRSGSVPVLPLAVGLMALGMVALAGVWWFTRETDAPVTPEVALPEPKPPEERPLAGPDRGDGDGWRWINPLPRALPTFFSVHVGGPGLVAMCGRHGACARLTGRGLAQWPSGTRSDLHAVAWTGASDAIAVGDDATIVLLGSRAPRLLETDLTGALRAAEALSPTEAIVAGDGGLLLRVVGTEVRQIAWDGEDALLALATRDRDVFVAGEHGTILRLQAGEVTRETSGTTATLRAIGGCPEGDLYAAGDEGRVLRRVGATWRGLRVATESEAWTGIACDEGRVAIIGARGSVLLVSGEHSVKLETGSDRPFYGVSGGHGERTWLVGAGGRIASLQPDHVSLLTAGPTSAIRDLGALGGALVAVGEYGRILREREDGLHQDPAEITSAALASLAALGDDRLLAVGDNGTLLEITAQGAEVKASGPAAWRDVVASGSNILVVGEHGALLRGPLEAAVTTVLADGQIDLWGVDGTPDDAIVVGSGGAVFRLMRGVATRVTCPTEVTLRSVVRAGERAWAAGDGGSVVRIEGDSCTVERSGGPALNGIAIGPHGGPFAVGDEGSAWERDGTGAWSALDLEASDQSLRAVTRLGRHVYVVGTGGVVRRHIVLDGS